MGGYIVYNLQEYRTLDIYVRSEDVRVQAGCIAWENEVSETTETNKKRAAVLNSFLA